LGFIFVRALRPVAFRTIAVETKNLEPFRKIVFTQPPRKIRQFSRSLTSYWNDVIQG